MCKLHVYLESEMYFTTYTSKISCPLSDRVGRGGGGVAVVQELKMRVKSERDEGERLRTQV